MKNKFILLIVLAFLSLLSGILISKMSFIGKIGISFFYNEYAIFKSWWKTALLLFLIQLLLFGLFNFFSHREKAFFKQKIIPTIFLFFGIFGLYYTYNDFTNTSHRVMKLSFHMGFYLFWITWFINCFFFIFKREKKKHINSFDDIYKQESQE